LEIYENVASFCSRRRNEETYYWMAFLDFFEVFLIPVVIWGRLTKGEITASSTYRIAPNCLCPSGARPTRERQASIRVEALCNDQTTGAEIGQASKGWIADQPRNALKMVVLRHQHTARGAEGQVIVLYSPFRQTSPNRPKNDDPSLWEALHRETTQARSYAHAAAARALGFTVEIPA
jgi:hypothetical protein